jgi:hypothetical protein
MLAGCSPARRADALEASAWFLPGALAARGSLGSSVFTLKRREDVRGSDVRRLCSCFRLLADSGRWRSDRSKRVRLRLSACARSSSRPFLGLRVTGRQERRSNRKVGSSLAGSSELARRLKAFRIVKAAALHGATGTAILAVRCLLTRGCIPHGDEASEASRTCSPRAEQARGCPTRRTEACRDGVNRAAHRSLSGQNPGGNDKYRTHGYSSLTIGFAVVSRTHLPASATETSLKLGSSVGGAVLLSQRREVSWAHGCWRAV